MVRFQTLHGMRVVARPADVDLLVGRQSDDVVVMRFAPDDLFLVGHPGTPECDDPHAIIDSDTGYSGAWLTVSEFKTIIGPHMEWQMPTDGRLGQGLIGGVPAKVQLDGNVALVLCPTAFVDELEGRLG